MTLLTWMHGLPNINTQNADKGCCPMLSMQQITKRFACTLALDGVDFQLRQGEIHALLGENGAGKTTLMKILYGMIKPDAGQILLDDQVVNMRHSTDALAKGICMVHQHFMLIPAFTILENVITNDEPKKGMFTDKVTARERVQALIDQFDFDLDPDALVENLSVGEQQRVEILKALYRKARILILDEPTAVLTPHEVDNLFVVLRLLKTQGKSIIIITHKLRETFAIADRITVLRDGKVINQDVLPQDTDVQGLSCMMVGRQIQRQRPTKHIETGEVCLEVEHISYSEGSIARLKDLSFSVHKGEILGVAGIEGNGQSQLLEILTGLCKSETGTIRVNGKLIQGDAGAFLRNHISHIPEDRLSMGLVKEMSVQDNLILGYHHENAVCKNGFMQSKTIQEHARELIKRYQIKTFDAVSQVSTLSGGNQQKIVIARALGHDPEVLIAAHPTRGVDIGAMEYIHSKIIELRDSGKAILLVSADLDEVRTLSDRIIVLYEGQIVLTSMPGEHSEMELGIMMTGGVLSDASRGDCHETT